MFTSPINAAPPKIVPLTPATAAGCCALVSRSPTIAVQLAHTPMPPSTRYRNATAIIQTKNSATDSTSDTFSALHGSTLRICIPARTGPVCRRVPTWMRLVAGPGRARWLQATGRSGAQAALPRRTRRPARTGRGSSAGVRLGPCRARCARAAPAAILLVRRRRAGGAWSARR